MHTFVSSQRRWKKFSLNINTVLLGGIISRKLEYYVAFPMNPLLHDKNQFDYQKKRARVGDNILGCSTLLMNRPKAVSNEVY